MRDYFYYDGKSSAEFNTYVSNAITQFDSSKRDTQKYKIPGKNGELTLDNGRFENQPHKYEVYVCGALSESMEELRSWLMCTSEYRELKDTLHPDEFYMARFIDEIKVEKSDRRGAKLTLTFDRMPQRFLEKGKIPINIPGNTSIHNMTRYPAKPLIRAYGTGTFTISGVTVTIDRADTYTDIDCELDEIYKDTLSNSKNDCVTLEGGKLPVLNPGDNPVILSGITELKITPRWWTR